MKSFVKGIQTFITIIVCAFMAIMVHAFLPAGVKEEKFDSLLVRLLGFKGTAVLYFVILYTCITFVVKKYGCRSQNNGRNTGLLFGISFALLYMVGMQEIVLAPSPYSSWGLSYIRYQFFMGLGDAIPVLLLCLIIVKIYKNTESDQDKEKLLLHNINTATKLPSGLNWVIHTGVYVCLILMERIIMNKWKLIAGNYDVYPLETILWTIIFGITLGTMSWLLAPLVNNEGRLKKNSNLAFDNYWTELEYI